MDSSDDARVDSLLSLLWQQLHDHALVLTDAQGIIVHWGGAAPRVLGYRPQDVVGRPISIIFTDEDVQRGVPELERSIAGTDGRSEDDRWHVRHDGARIWVTGTLTPLRSQGRLVGFAKILRDRTDQRMEIEQCRNRLQTAELALAGAEANFARIVHELRNSLGPIRSATDILSRNGPGSESGPPVAILRRQADVMQRLLSDLADAARVRSGKGGLRLRPLDLVEEIAHICDSVRAKAQAMQQDLVVLLPRAPLPVQADRVVEREKAAMPGLELSQEGRARVNNGVGYEVGYQRFTDDERYTGRQVLLVPDDPKEGKGAVLLSLSLRSPGGRKLTPPERNLAYLARKAYRSFRFGTDRG